jgi:hypothetical protein
MLQEIQTRQKQIAMYQHTALGRGLLLFLVVGRQGAGFFIVEGSLVVGWDSNDAQRLRFNDVVARHTHIRRKLT